MFEVKHVRHTRVPSAEPIHETPAHFEPLTDGTATAPPKTGIVAELRAVNWRNVWDLFSVQTAVMFTLAAYVFLPPMYEETMSGLVAPDAVQWPMRWLFVMSDFLREHPSVIVIVALGCLFQLFMARKRWLDTGSPENHWIPLLNNSKRARTVFSVLLWVPAGFLSLAAACQLWPLIWALYERGAIR